VTCTVDAQRTSQPRWFRGLVVLGLAGALVGVVPDGVSAAPAHLRCRATAFIGNTGSGTVSTIDVKTRAKNPTDIPVGSFPQGLSFTPDGKTAFVGNRVGDTVSTIDVKTRTKNPTNIPVGPNPLPHAVTPDGKTVFVSARTRRGARPSLRRPRRSSSSSFSLVWPGSKGRRSREVGAPGPGIDLLLVAGGVVVAAATVATAGFTDGTRRTEMNLIYRHILRTIFRPIALFSMRFGMRCGWRFARRRGWDARPAPCRTRRPLRRAHCQKSPV
jgi:YVTN family beta-propeller protein